MPKPLVDVAGVPLLERQVLLAKQYGFDDILLLVNHGAERIIEFCRARGNWGLDIQCVDDGVPRGTAGATLKVMDRLSDEFLVIYGDTMLAVDLRRFVEFHQMRPDAAATLLVHPNDHPHDSDLVEVDEDGRVSAFHPYPHDAGRFYANLVNAALYCVRKAALQPWREAPEMEDFGKDLFPAMLARGVVLRTYNSPEYIKDCGTPARLDRVCDDLLSGRVARSSLAVPQCAVFLDRDGTINADYGHIDRAERFDFLPGAATAIRRLNRSEYRAVVVTNQPVLARGDCTPTEIRRIHAKMETGLGQDGAYLDRIYFCPHHPDRGFAGEVPELKIDCTCRKPGIGMIERAVKELNIDVMQSWLVGDSTVDVLTARRAGLRSILVETGAGGLDRRHWISSDYTAPDLAAAVTFILDEHSRLLTLCAGLARDITEGDVVFVGGLSRSGKSTLASGLAEVLRAQHRHAVILSADRWLRSFSERSKGVLGRYDMVALAAMVSHIAEANRDLELLIPAYDKVDRRCIDAIETLAIPAHAVIIIEGVVSLFVRSAAAARTSHAFFVEIDEDVRRDRITREYIRRGETREGAEAIYRTRQEDESLVVLGALPACARRIVVPCAQ
ncbi:HAD-IIIA family hydrolase [Methylovirgula sp. HY1]|uniref:HAD-IIIA family hydrolase n=1 Tax=Methylovirgula sp. HY1 TaxID=2822761 RepID=UPI00210605E6|nr:HAD-IIIA family hydrolase [Methylovirgula sp. HY1]